MSYDYGFQLIKGMLGGIGSMAQSALPQTKQQLKDEIHKRYLLLDQEFNDLTNTDRDIEVEGVDRTPAEIIAYQIGWLQLVMGWDKAEKAGQKVHMPKEGYKWNRLGDMYQAFYEECKPYTLEQLRQQFQLLEQQFQDWLDTLTEEELFTQGVRQWTGDNPTWPMVRWIKINTISPFTNFRTKIRKWKKAIQR